MSWHLTRDKFWTLYSFNYYSHCVFSVILGGFFGQVSSIMYVFDLRGWCRFNNEAFNLTPILGGYLLGYNTNWHKGGGGCLKRLQNFTRIIWMAPKPIFNSASKNDAQFKSGKNWLKNKQLASLIWIRLTHSICKIFLIVRWKYPHSIKIKQYFLRYKKDRFGKKYL